MVSLGYNRGRIGMIIAHFLVPHETPSIIRNPWSLCLSVGWFDEKCATEIWWMDAGYLWVNSEVSHIFMLDLVSHSELRQSLNPMLSPVHPCLCLFMSTLTNENPPFIDEIPSERSI